MRYADPDRPFVNVFYASSEVATSNRLRKRSVRQTRIDPKPRGGCCRQLLYGLGGGGFENRYPKLLGAMGWRQFAILFFFIVTRAATLFDNLTYASRSWWEASGPNFGSRRALVAHNKSG
jgi:hypothetical protein